MVKLSTLVVALSLISSLQASQQKMTQEAYSGMPRSEMEQRRGLYGNRNYQRGGIGYQAGTQGGVGYRADNATNQAGIGYRADGTQGGIGYRAGSEEMTK